MLSLTPARLRGRRRLLLAAALPSALAATALPAVGKPARVRLSWRHPKAWKQLKTIELRLLSEHGIPVGEVRIRPGRERIAAHGAVALVRKQTRLGHKGKTVTARLALRLDESLAGQTLRAEVEATDRRGRRQLERDAGTVRVAR